jgi:hypothetical protein
MQLPHVHRSELLSNLLQQMNIATVDPANSLQFSSSCCHAPMATD